MSSIALRNARGSAPLAGTTSTERMRPRAEGISSNRHDRPDKSGCSPGGAAGDREFAALHRRVRPAETAAGKHRIGQIGRRPETRDADVEALRAHGFHRHQRHPHRKIEVFPDPGRGRRQRLARAAEIGGRHRKARAIAAEHERKLASIQRIGDGGDDSGARHVDRLVALVGDRLGRFHDIGDADGPIVRQRRIQRRIHQAGEAAKDRNAAVEDVGAVGRGHCDASYPVFRSCVTDTACPVFGFAPATV